MGLLSKALKYKSEVHNENDIEDLHKTKKSDLGNKIDAATSDSSMAIEDDLIILDDDDIRYIDNNVKDDERIKFKDDHRKDYSEEFEVIDQSDFVLAENNKTHYSDSKVVVDDRGRAEESENEVNEKIGKDFFGSEKTIVIDKTFEDDKLIISDRITNIQEENGSMIDNSGKNITSQIGKFTIPEEDKNEASNLINVKDITDKKSIDESSSVSPGEIPVNKLKPEKNRSVIVDEVIDLKEISGDELKFNDFMLLYEIQKEIARANTADELYDVILFSLMGQIGTSSSSIMVRSPKNVNKWVIVKSIGVTIENEDLYFNPTSGILEKLFERKEIIDIDEFKNDPMFIDDYYKYISIDGKLLVPLKQGYEILGTVILGEKLDIREYTDEDNEFLNFVGEVSAIALNNINTMEMIMKVNENLSRDFGFIRDVDRFKKKIFHDMSLSKVESDFQNEFNEMGIEGYAVFVKNADDKNFSPIITGKNDILGIKESGIIFNEKSSFIKYLNKPEIPIIIDNPRESDLVNETFKIEQLLKISIFRIYPLLIGNNVMGFILVYKISDETVLDEIDKKLTRISEFIFTHIQNIFQLNIKQSNYVDNIEIIFKRIEEEIFNAKNLGIPLTVVMMSIKNHKRYLNLFGPKSFQKLLDSLEQVIKKRLSDNDFSFRYGRHKVLIVLPGKDKKYATPLSSSISSEIVSSFNSKEIQLLITSLSAEFSADGNDLNSLINIIDY